MRRPRIVIAGTNSGAGKTTFTIGLMAAFAKRGKVVQGYKVGPDYIDPSYHTAVTGRPSRNLDSWMADAACVRELFWRSGGDADISIIEGVMGLYDGKDPLTNTGSTAELATILNAPVILVLNAAKMARSAAAMVLGFQRFAPDVHIAGVLVNQVASAGHYQLVKAAIEQECGVPALGYLLRSAEIDVPERHLGLVPAIERGELEPLFDVLAKDVAQTVDLDAIEEIAGQAAELFAPPVHVFSGAPKEPITTIAVARDQAFNFYYPENLELLGWHGALLKYFSPCNGERIPEDANGLYIGGGFPEEYADILGANAALRAHFRDRIAQGLPTFAECGGFMFLTESLTDRAGQTHPMVGSIPAAVKMQERLVALGYRDIRALHDNLLLKKGDFARGHEFHYSIAQFHMDEGRTAYKVTGTHGAKEEGYCTANLLAAYTHVYFPSNPDIPRRFVSACRAFRLNGSVAF